MIEQLGSDVRIDCGTAEKSVNERSGLFLRERGTRIVDELTLPPPQPGRRASSSGRAEQMARIGTPLAQSRK
jgi:hypothetical protein